MAAALSAPLIMYIASC